MNTILYEVKDAVGLPTGHLGAGNPDALYAGSLILGHRIEEFIPRLVELGAIAPAANQNQPENILSVPNANGNPVVESAPMSNEQRVAEATGGSSKQGVASMSAADLRAAAEGMGIDVPTRATKAEIQALIDAKVAANETEDDEPVQGVANGGGQ
jgi:hypothetical protein